MYREGSGHQQNREQGAQGEAFIHVQAIVNAADPNRVYAIVEAWANMSGKGAPDNTKIAEAAQAKLLEFAHNHPGNKAALVATIEPRYRDHFADWLDDNGVDFANKATVETKTTDNLYGATFQHITDPALLYKTGIELLSRAQADNKASAVYEQLADAFEQRLSELVVTAQQAEKLYQKLPFDQKDAFKKWANARFPGGRETAEA